MPSSNDIWAYIDETGDRGSGRSSSPIFGMAAVLVDDVGAVLLRRAVEQLRNDFGVPVGTAMSWKDHVKTHDRRRRAASVLGAVSSVKICYVYAVKDQLDPSSYVGDRERFYSYVAYKMYKSVIWAARNWHGNQTRLWSRFGHVRHHDHAATEQYIREEATSDYRIPFHMEQGLKWVSADKYLESQAADIYGGFLRAAIWPSGDWGYVEPSYLLTVWSQIRNSEACAIPLGIMSMPRNDILSESSWFPCAPCPKRTST